MDGHRVEDALQRPLSAHLADLRLRIGHALEQFEDVPFGAAVLIGGHDGEEAISGSRHLLCSSPFAEFD